MAGKKQSPREKRLEAAIRRGIEDYVSPTVLDEAVKGTLARVTLAVNYRAPI